MSKLLNDGGPAFPFSFDRDKASTTYLGMSLRDWFAGQAKTSDTEFPSLESLAEFAGIEPPEPNDFIAMLEIAIMAKAKLKYMEADAMLAAREET